MSVAPVAHYVVASGSINGGKVAQLRNEIESTYEMRSGELADKVHALNAGERNELLRTLSPHGLESLTLSLARASSRNPAAYQRLQHDLLAGQPPAQIQRLLDVALSWDRPDNPPGQALGRTVLRGVSDYIAAHGTQGQKLGLIGHLTDARRGGAAARQDSAAAAVYVLFRSLPFDRGAATRALAMMSRGDKAAVAQQALNSGNAAGVRRYLQVVSLGTDAAQRSEAVAPFVVHAAQLRGDARKALVDGVTRIIAPQIHAAAAAHGVSAEAIAAILYQELNTRGSDDAVQDQLAAAIAGTAPGSAQRQQAIERAQRSPQLAGKDITRQTTLGYAQLSVEGVARLFGSRWDAGQNRYVADGTARNYLQGLMSREQFLADPVGHAMRLLTRPELAPALVGAWAQRVIVLRQGNRANEDIALLPAGANEDMRQQRASLHYRYLTGSYSNGGLIKSVGGQPVGQGNYDPARTQTPGRYAVGELSPGERTAWGRRSLIQELLH